MPPSLQNREWVRLPLRPWKVAFKDIYGVNTTNIIPNQLETKKQQNRQASVLRIVAFMCPFEPPEDLFATHAKSRVIILLYSH